MLDGDNDLQMYDHDIKLVCVHDAFLLEAFSLFGAVTGR